MAELVAKRRVVVAEDESLIRMDVVETLREHGFDVVAEVGDYFKACLKAGERLPAPAPLQMTMDRARRALSSQALAGDDDTRLNLLHALSGLRLARGA